MYIHKKHVYMCFFITSYFKKGILIILVIQLKVNLTKSWLGVRTEAWLDLLNIRDAHSQEKINYP